MNDGEKFLTTYFNCTKQRLLCEEQFKRSGREGGGAFAVSPSITVLSLSNSEGGPSTTADYRVIKSGANVNEGFL